MFNQRNNLDYRSCQGVDGLSKAAYLTIVAATGAAGNWSSGSAWIGGTAPTAADDAQITATTTSITIDATAVCRGADFTGFTGTLTAGATAVLTVGTSTAALSNIALKIPSGATFAPNAAATINFISTSSTQQTISVSNTYTMGNMTINGAGSNYAIIANLTVGTTSTLTLTAGTLHTDGASDTSGLTHSWGFFNSNNSNTRTLTLGTANITITGASTSTWLMATVTNMTFSGASSVITFTGVTSTFNAGGKTYGTVNMTGSGVATATGFTAAIFNRTGTASKTDSFVSTANTIITGTITFAGNSSINRLLVQATTVGTQITFTNTSTTMTISNCDFMDMKFSVTWDASARTDIGDCGGNSGITFPASSTQTWNGTSGGNWSTNAWTTRVPLPQDDVVINNAFSASQTVTADMPRLGRSIDWTGSTGTSMIWTVSLGTGAASIFGSLTLISTMSFTVTSGSIIYAGRSTYTLTSAGVVTAMSANIVAPTGTYTLQDAYACTGSSGFVLTMGGFNGNGFNITAPQFSSNNTNTRTLTLGNGIWTITWTSGGNAWVIASTNLTFSGANATIVLSGSTSNIKLFAGGSQTYGTLTYTVAGSTGELDITGANTFTTINFSDSSNARSLKFTAATTTTITGSFNVNGTSGKLMTVTSITGATFTLTASAQQNCVFLNLTNCVVDASPKWFAGNNSVDNGGNTNWVFSASSPSPSLSPSASRSPSSSNSPSISPSGSLSPSSSQSPSASISASLSPSSSISPSAAPASNEGATFLLLGV